MYQALKATEKTKLFEKNSHKIIFTGPVGAGKTTAIKTLSDTPVISTEQYATDDVKDKKEKTTVAMDYGMVRLDGGENIHLYGTPGQRRFDFMWEILVQNAIGVVILVDNANEDPTKDLDFFLSHFSKLIKDKGVAVAVGLTRTDLRVQHKLDDYHKILKKYQFSSPVFEVDARKGKEVSMLVQALLFSIDQSVEEQSVEEQAMYEKTASSLHNG